MTADRPAPRRATSSGPEPAQRMRRTERRAQILNAATRAFARTGFTATGLDDVATEAGISRVILYRHFESKTDLYRAVLDHACARLDEAVGTGEFDERSVPALLRAAAADPAGFRLLFRHAAREPEFRDVTDTLRTTSTDLARRDLAAMIPRGAWLEWAAQLLPSLAVEAVIAWLDAGQPDPEHAAERLDSVIRGVIDAAQPR